MTFRTFESLLQMADEGYEAVYKSGKKATNLLRIIKTFLEQIN